jgi:hypothetical protein
VWDWLGKFALVIATAVAAYALGPRITNKWQDHKDALARRGALVTQISNASGRFLGATQVAAHSKGAASPAFDSAFVNWQVASEALHSQISAYENARTATEWSNYASNTLWVYYVFKRTGAVRPALALHRVATYLGRPFNTLNGLLDQPYTPKRTVNPTYESALNELILQLRLKERSIVSDILH